MYKFFLIMPKQNVYPTAKYQVLIVALRTEHMMFWQKKKKSLFILLKQLLMIYERGGVVQDKKNFQ